MFILFLVSKATMTSFTSAMKIIRWQRYISSSILKNQVESEDDSLLDR